MLETTDRKGHSGSARGLDFKLLDNSVERYEEDRIRTEKMSRPLALAASVAWALMICLSSVVLGQVLKQDAELSALRKATMVDFTDPAAHLALARAHMKESRILAFRICEDARKRAGDLAFDRAFAQVIRATTRPASTQAASNAIVTDQERELFQRIVKLSQQGKDEAVSLVVEAVARHPDSARWRITAAGVLLAAGKVTDAEKEAEAAAALGSGVASVQVSVGLLFLKLKKEDRALSCFLDAYFIDPHCYAGEYVEFRIKRLVEETGRAQYQNRVIAGATPDELLSERNPAVAIWALGAMAESWKPEYGKAVIAAMAHDDPDLRLQAALLLAGKLDQAAEPLIRSLLIDADLRTRGMAALVAAKVLKEQSHDDLKRMLAEEAPFLRFWAIIALFGDEKGKSILREYAESGREEDAFINRTLLELHVGAQTAPLRK